MNCLCISRLYWFHIQLFFIDKNKNLFFLNENLCQFVCKIVSLWCSHIDSISYNNEKRKPIWNQCHLMAISRVERSGGQRKVKKKLFWMLNEKVLLKPFYEFSDNHKKKLNILWKLPGTFCSNSFPFCSRFFSFVHLFKVFSFRLIYFVLARIQ